VSALYEKLMAEGFIFDVHIQSKPLKKKANFNHKRTDLPEQPLPITIENFFIRTKAVFQKIDSIPAGYKSFFKSKGSEYFTNEDKSIVIRVSDHWGYKIRFCNWFLKMEYGGSYEQISSFKWSKIHSRQKFIGKCRIADFSPAKRTPFKGSSLQTIEKLSGINNSRWPE